MNRTMKKLIGFAALVAVLVLVVARVHANDSLLPVGAAAPEVVGLVARVQHPSGTPLCPPDPVRRLS